MSSRDFEDALKEVGSDALGSRLCELISTGSLDNSEKGLPVTAAKYLRAFWDDGRSSSALERRWIGLALASMMHVSTNVIKHLSGLSRDLHGLGNVILKQGEAEELKIMAGIIMRLGLKNGIDFASFWASDKVKQSIPPFPEESCQHWMSEFQTFVMALDEVGLAHTKTDDSIVYPVSMFDSDGFKWGNADLAVGVLHSTQLTVMAPDYILGTYQFIDVPLSHVLSVESQESLPFDSQSELGRAQSKSYILQVALQADSWTYQLNASEHTASTISFEFARAEEADEWEECIRQHQFSAQNKAVRPFSSPTQTKGASASHEPSSRRAHYRSSQCSESIDISRPRSTRHARQVDTDDCSTVVEDSYPLTNTAQLQQPQHLNSPEWTRPISSNDGEVNQSTEQDLSDEARDEQPVSKPTTAESRKGKLPKVLHATKVNATKANLTKANLTKTNLTKANLTKANTTKANTTKVNSTQSSQKRPQDFDIPQERATRKSARISKAVYDDASEDSSPGQKKPTVKPKTATHASNTNNQSKKMQTRRKAEDDDDDEFIPEKPTPNPKKGDKRKRSPDIVPDDEQLKTKTRTRPTNARISSSGVKSKTRRAEVQPIEGPEPASSQRESKTNEAKQDAMEVYSSPMGPPPNTLIGGLMRSHKFPQAQIEVFKKPSQTTWDNQLDQLPSTPTKSKSRPLARTQVEAQRPPQRTPVGVLSSPSVASSMRRDSSLRRQAFADTEILSSNTKRGPASPHAESTAISGHADREEVDMEREIADNKTAKNDPFNRRSEKPKSTTFIRRLTSEHPANDDLDMREEDTSIMPVEMDYGDFSEDEAVPIVAGPVLVSKRQNLEAKHPGSQRVSRTTKSGLLGDAQTPVKDQSRAMTKKVLQSLDNELPSKPSNLPGASRLSHLRSGEYTPKQGLVADKGPEKSVAKARKERSGVQKGETTSTAFEQTTQTAQPERRVQYEGDAYADDDTTLVNCEGDIQFISSPPVAGSVGSHSSTSADSDVTPEPSPPTSQADEAIEWENSLHSYQRPLHDLLKRVSNRALRNIFDNETAVSDIAEEFSRDGEHLLKSILEQHDAEYADAFEDLEGKKKQLQKQLEAARRSLVKERERVHATD